ncbi:hypothetical protein MPC4_80178 [Methylocella tundrae]|uniref:Uncharacterized protein n=1 Tax=Methylocella tundrae TaxID=227605 RepID=A0A8B6MBU3_METTU|nr:hypothetical protein MPC1_3750004 [Methylocella tundrae]VTZ52507.1 hypothetical protein MPC4_80178 [Methylocella tundrae]
MIRVTFDLLPGGDANRARTIGIMEIANIGIHGDGTADYAVALKKTPPFAGALRAAWKKGKVSSDDTALNAVMAGEDDELITALAMTCCSARCVPAGLTREIHEPRALRETDRARDDRGVGWLAVRWRE